MIVDACGADVGVAEPFLHLGDVGLVVERVGRGGRTERMRADLKPEQRGIAAHDPVNPVGGDRPFHPSGAVVADRPEQRTVFIGAVTGRVKVVVDQPVGAGMQRQIPGLTTLAGHLEVRHAFARVPEILDLELAQLLAAKRVEQQRREDGAVALAL